MSEHILIDDADYVRTITFNRPDKKNALTQAMYNTMADAMADADVNPAVRVIVFRGAGDSFTAGNDMGDFLAHSGGDVVRGVERYLHALVHTETPLMAAVHGAAVGIGLTLLLHCDLVYADETAKLRAPFVDLGLVPEAASSILLPAQVGNARAGEIFFLGETLSGAEAVEAGLVARLFPSERLVEETHRRALSLAQKAPTAVRETKRLLRSGREVLAARIAEENRIFADRLQSDEFREAAAAFLEKRTPDFASLS